MTRRHLMGYGIASIGLSGCASVAAGEPLPKFHARTLDGKVFDNAAIQGKVLLLQFWATWCGYCRREQPSVDRITKEFESKGLIVLAVNVGESRDTVVEYLRHKPRACPVVMAPNDTNLASIFRAEGFPKYVIVNREGKVAGNQDGAGGMLALRDLLSSAGLVA